MSNLNDFKGISSITWGFIVFFLISTIIPGMLLLFLFNEELYLNLESVKLLCLSMGITFPVWFVNTVLAMFRYDKELKDDLKTTIKEDLQIVGLLGAILSIPVMYSPILANLFVDIKAQEALYIGFFIEVIIITIYVRIIWRNNKDRQDK
jgi:hypothetical protein